MSKESSNFGPRTFWDRLASLRRSVLYALKEITVHLLTFGGLIAVAMGWFLGMSLGAWCLPLLIGGVLAMSVGIIAAFYW